MPACRCSHSSKQPLRHAGGVDRDKLRDISDRKRDQRREVAPTQDSRRERDGREADRSDGRRTDHDRHHRLRWPSALWIICHVVAVRSFGALPQPVL